ncbi:MAG TPA: N-acetyltransferase [Herpetosiphon sp.]|uniref:GCN5-related N-acetyltransferase n=1 Tax=Herpetosiphon aurantiacus (strain ATCC 23779 / DSM 785 / 114-95) TaxID=316274 RepID=A9B784_HERA2|nr:GNAT family N-acetyltransferase [Herpetosiphon sp.]ABX06367.1 GCN5-related N-acetyltransferase [Herpetosiphon aurantiacus DSM 785]HBW49800.1 N-acetyltransferase [Herpetosiphon sp.]
MQPNYTIRRPTQAELSMLPAIEVAAAQLFLPTQYAFIAAWPPATLEDLAAYFSWDGVWVAVDIHTTPVGFALAKIVDGEVYLSELDVHPEHGQRGLGRGLIKAVAAWGKQQGYRHMSLLTFNDIAWNALFYARLGFRALTAAECGPELTAIAQGHIAAGLPATARVAMLAELDQLLLD